MTVRICPFTTK